ncbi:MAG: GH3 auxin-responsive promoter family protein [Bacteroidetes bacterium]|nr:GH3 auxin-responsive promoter family protein [Bacteroidota bacterium]
MPIINSVLSWIMKQRLHQIELFMKFPNEVQQDLLKKLIIASRYTEFGRRFDFSSISSSREFRERIPIQDYESLKPYIFRLKAGEQQLLWPSDVLCLAKSSGTTNDKSKFIPVTTEALEECHYKGGKDLLCMYFHNNPETQLFNGKLLTLGGSHQINSLNNDSFYGDLSAILIQNLPFWIQLFRTPERSIALMDEWEEKIEMMAKTCMFENVTNIAGVPSWTLVLLKRILEISGKNNLLEIWPNLELFVHGAVSFTPYKDQFRKLIPKSDMFYLETYNASEGFFGIQDRLYSEDMLLMLDYGIYYEFLPVSEWDKENPKTITLDEVKLNENYAIIITTNAGLWRYKIGDTVAFTSLSPFRIRITGRTAHFINAFGEELIIDNADKAIQSACHATGAIIREYTAGPVYFSDQSSGAHEWIIEFITPPIDIHDFTVLLDDALKSQNSDYEAKRYKDKVLALPIIHNVPPNTFYEWMKRREKLGGQHKVPRLSNNRNYLEEILNNVQVGE